MANFLHRLLCRSSRDCLTELATLDRTASSQHGDADSAFLDGTDLYRCYPSGRRLSPPADVLSWCPDCSSDTESTIFSYCLRCGGSKWSA